MELEIVKRGLEFSRSKKKWLIVLGLVGVSGYGACKVYNMPSVVRKRKRIMMLLGAIVSIAEMVSDTAETVGIVSKDLKEFVKSDSDKIPNSLTQLSKVARSDEFAQSLIRVSEAITVGVLRGYRAANGSQIEEDGKRSNFSDRIMDKLMSSSAGTGFVSVVVGSFARNLVLGFYSKGQLHEGLNENGSCSVPDMKSNSSTSPGWVDVMCDEKCKVLIADCVKTFISTAVAVYLDKTMDINFYDDIFSGMTNPKHQDEVRDILVSLCNGAMETLVKTSHEVLTSSKPKSESSSSSFSIVDENEALNPAVDGLSHQVSSERTNGCTDLQSNGWMKSVSSTLSVPSNRRFVIGVTGAVTLATIRSLVEFLWWKILELLKISLNVVHHQVAERGMEVIRYVGAKSSVVVTFCFALFLHIFGSTQVLVPR